MEAIGDLETVLSILPYTYVSASSQNRIRNTIEKFPCAGKNVKMSENCELPPLSGLILSPFVKQSWWFNNDINWN